MKRLGYLKKTGLNIVTHDMTAIGAGLSGHLLIQLKKKK
jgi:hypothetical protein